MTSFPGLFRIDGASVLVTGAGSGMGRATARLLASAGAKHVFLCGRRFELLRETAKLMKEDGSGAEAHVAAGDVTDAAFRQTLLASVAKLAYPERQCVNITGDAGVCYMMGDFEACVRHGIGITTLHINNGGFSGYGPGFWGGGHDPYTWKVSDHTVACMSDMARAVGMHAEQVKEPSEVVPALKRALEAIDQHIGGKRPRIPEGLEIYEPPSAN